MLLKLLAMVAVAAICTVQLVAQETDVINPKPAVLPALQAWIGDTGFFTANAQTRVVTGVADADVGKPKLAEYLQIFADDYAEIVGEKLTVSIDNNAEVTANVIDITLDAANQDEATFRAEGYCIEITPQRIRITAPTPLGAFWATRTLLQVFKQYGNKFPCGQIVDFPHYPIRGFMLDVGRKPVTLAAIYNVMKTMSWYKLNDLQIHLNDNYIWLNKYTQIPCDKDATPEQQQAAINEVLAANPSAFRLESTIVGANGHPLTSTDQFYTKAEFGKLIDDARKYGVNIVPEIDVPGHALSLIKVRPELMYRGVVQKTYDVERAALFDVSDEIYDQETNKTYRQESLDFIKQIFAEYLDPQGENKAPPVFRDAVVHIGTDEYYGDNEDFRAFADELLKYIKSKNFTPRYWGNLTKKFGTTPIISDGVQMQIWSLGWQNPRDALKKGYDIINIQDTVGYIVPSGKGNVGGYGDRINLPHIYSKNWAPHIMKTNKADLSIPAKHPQLKGAMWALWNDHSFMTDTGLTDYDLYERIQHSCAVYAEKTWHEGTDREFDSFMQLLEKVGLPPRHTLPRQLAKDEMAKINAAAELNNAEFKDGVFKLNGEASFINTGIADIAPNYTAEFSVKLLGDATEQILFSSPYGIFKAVQKNTGQVGFTNDTWNYSFNYKLPKNEWVKLKLVAQDKTLKLFVNEQEIGNPQRERFPESHQFNSFVFPAGMLGAEKAAFHGEIKEIIIRQ